MQPTRPSARTGRGPRRLASILALAAVVLAAVVLSACGGPATRDPAAPPASGAPSASTGGGDTGTVASGLGAVEAIRSRTPLFDAFQVKSADMIGQASSWTSEPAGDAWTVVFETGWGDCEAGCIDRHTWTWTVAHDGTLTFRGEAGSALPDGRLAQLASTSQNRTGVAGHATAGPTCPVERPGDPACVARNVGGAVLVVKDAGGGEVARFTTDGSGLFRVALPEGAYTLEAGPVEGLMGTPPPTPFTVAGGAETWLDLPYDTGLR